MNAFLQGTANFGWVLKRTSETGTGRVVFVAREGTDKPTLYLSLADKPKLTVDVGEGATGTPASGSVEYNAGNSVAYSFQLAQGYEDLVVMLDTTVVSPAGVVVMDTSHVLNVSARRILTPLGGTASLVTEAHDLLTATDKVAAFQSFLNNSIAYASSTDPITARQGLDIVTALAFNPVTDSAALEALDNSLSQHLFVFSGADAAPQPVPADSEAAAYVFVNGFLTDESYVKDVGGLLERFTDMVNHLPVKTSNDVITYFYNRILNRQVSSATDPVTTYIRCQEEASRRSKAPPFAYYKRLLLQCRNRASTALWDPFEAARQWVSLRIRSNVIEEDADSLARIIHGWRQTGRHTILMGHSQGTMMIQQAVLSMINTHGYQPQTDSVGIGAVLLAAPAGFNWPLDQYHKAHINVRGDLVAAIGGFPLINTPNSDAADAFVAAQTDPVNALAARTFFGFRFLHGIVESYFGQPGIHAMMGDSLTRIYRELAVGQISSIVSTLGLEAGYSQNIASTITINNQNGRRLYGRKVRYTSSNPGVATVDSLGIVRAVIGGQAQIVLQSHRFADTIFVTVANRPAEWGPTVTAHDSLTTGTWSGAWAGFAQYPPGETRDEGSGNMTLVLEAYTSPTSGLSQIRGTATWTGPRGSFSELVFAGNNRVFPPQVPGQPTAYTARVYFRGELPELCSGYPDHALDLVFGGASAPSDPRSAYGYSYLSCNLWMTSPSHSRRMLTMSKTSGPQSSLLAP